MAVTQPPRPCTVAVERAVVVVPEVVEEVAAAAEAAAEAAEAAAEEQGVGGPARQGAVTSLVPHISFIGIRCH